MIIVGIDPGTTRIGYAVVEVDQSSFLLLKSGLFSIKSGEHSLRLVEIRKEILSLIQKYNIDRFVVESLFFSKNVKTGLFVAEARGVIIETIVEAHIKLIETTPNQAKQSITGSGSATKKDINKMVGLLFKKDLSKYIDDEVDAIAIAIAGSGRLS